MSGSKIINPVFYGYPASLIAKWCCVSEDTARRWKNGQRKPSDSALALFALHRDRRVLGPEFTGWCVKGSVLVDPEQNEFTQAQLRAYRLVYEAYRERIRGDDAALEEYRLWLKMGAG